MIPKGAYVICFRDQQGKERFELPGKHEVYGQKQEYFTDYADVEQWIKSNMKFIEGNFIVAKVQSVKNVSIQDVKDN